MKLYAYKNCDTCRKAKKWLTAQGIEFEEIAIREKPPTAAELKRMLAAYDGELRRLFNTSSKDYREAGLKDVLPTMKPADAFKRLRENGNLVKRPFLVSDDAMLVGFKEPEWKAALS